MPRRSSLLYFIWFSWPFRGYIRSVRITWSRVTTFRRRFVPLSNIFLMSLTENLLSSIPMQLRAERTYSEHLPISLSARSVLSFCYSATETYITLAVSSWRSSSLRLLFRARGLSKNFFRGFLIFWAWQSESSMPIADIPLSPIPISIGWTFSSICLSVRRPSCILSARINFFPFPY